MIHPENPCLLVTDDGYHEFWCPGCEGGHSFTVDRKNRNGASWSVQKWNPLTVSPSVVMTMENRHGQVVERCHLFIRDGNLQFLSDCSHHLAGKTVPMVPWEEA